MCPIQVQIKLKYWFLRVWEPKISTRVCHRSDLTPESSPGETKTQSKSYCGTTNVLYMCLQICDFGLARIEEPDEHRHMTQEVVTQYYRAPEILMGTKHYSSGINIIVSKPSDIKNNCYKFSSLWSPK